MTRRDLKKLTEARLLDAKVLMGAGRHQAGYYLTGMAVECALKACIAKKIQRYEFPDLETAKNSWHHDLSKLVKTAGLESERLREEIASPGFSRNWALVKDWNIEVRYEASVRKTDADALYQAVIAQPAGVLTWLRRHW